MPSSERDFFDVRAVARNTAFPSPVRSPETPHFRAPRSRRDCCSHEANAVVRNVNTRPRSFTEYHGYARGCTADARPRNKLHHEESHSSRKAGVSNENQACELHFRNPRRKRHHPELQCDRWRSHAPERRLRPPEGHAHALPAPRAGLCDGRRELRPHLQPAGASLRDLRPGRHQCHHRRAWCLARLHPDADHLRPGPL